MVTQKFAMPNNHKTGVWWDINSCPLPNGYEPSRVRTSIMSALNRTVGSGPVTICAAGDVKSFPPSVVQELASSGISIRHCYRSLGCIQGDIIAWKSFNPPPGNIMLISNDPLADPSDYHYQGRGMVYNVIRGYPTTTTFSTEFWYRQGYSASCFSTEILWESLLQSPLLQETPAVQTETQIFLPDPWYCEICNFHCDSFEDFYEHLDDYVHRGFEDSLRYTDLEKQAKYRGDPSVSYPVLEEFASLFQSLGNGGLYSPK